MKNYSWLNCVLLVNGIPATGLDEGDDVVSMSRIEDSASHKIGIDGEMTVSIHADRAGIMTLRTMQTSTFNKFLSGLISGQENGAFVPVFLQFKDTQGGDLASATQGYIPRPADMVRGQKANAQEWSFVCERLDMLHNGS